MPQPQPPAGYSLLPNGSSPTAGEGPISSFIQQGMDTKSVQQRVLPAPASSAEFPGTETVAEAHPGEIDVYRPNQYDSRAEDHEMTHEYQFSRADGTIHLPFGYQLAPFGETKPYAPEAYPAGDPRNYSYGGEAGLEAAHNSGKSMADFNLEQQADIVADYQQKQNAYLAKAKYGRVTKDDLAAMYKTYQAYHPLVQQLASVPGSSSGTLPSIKTILGIGKPDPLAPAPAAPGLPSYAVAGMSVAPADPLLWGKSVPLKVGQ